MSLTQKLWVLRLPKPQHIPAKRIEPSTVLDKKYIKTLRISIAISHFFWPCKSSWGSLPQFSNKAKNIFFTFFFSCHSYPKRNKNGKSLLEWPTAIVNHFINFILKWTEGGATCSFHNHTFDLIIS